MTTVTVISFWLPLLWALFIGLSWRYVWKDPINHPAICIFMGALGFFFFGWTILAFIIVWIFKKGILNSLMNKKDEQGK